MRVSCTASREGMTVTQWLSIRNWLWNTNSRVGIESFHHGCCIRGDAEFVLAVLELGIGDCTVPKIIAYPSNIPSMVDEDAKAASDVVYDPLPPLERNPIIVDNGDVLLAAPAGPEELRSGTWSTIRDCRRKKKWIVIFWPDGSMTEENAPNDK